MNKSMLTGLVIGATAVTAVGGVAGYKMIEGPSFAEVIKVQEVKEEVRTPRQVCEDVLVNKQVPVKDENRLAGTAIGAVVGGLLGNQVGDGRGNTLATVGGAVAGGYAGNRIQANMQASNTQAVKENRCKTVYDTEQKHVGYDVEYRLGDKEAVVRMNYDPGQRIPVKDGQLVLTPQPDHS